MAAIDRLMTITASTKRAPAVTGGRVGAAVTHLASLRCMPLDPNTPDSMRELVTDIAYRPLFTLAAGVVDIVEGDVLVVSGHDYPIQHVQRFDWKSTEYRLLMVEDRN